MYFDSRGNAISLGPPLGNGAAAQVYTRSNDKNRALKIFRPEYLKKEPLLPDRIEKLYQLEQIGDFNIQYGDIVRSVGSWPNEVVKNKQGRIIGYQMDSVKGGIDLSHVVTSNFYKYRQSPHYDQWTRTYAYGAETLRNRFILCYYLSNSFGKIYDLKTRQGAPINLDLCNFDIKPKNILVSIEQTRNSLNIIPFILDLDNLTFRNQTGKLGPAHPQYTPDYMAPEGPVDKYYDYYSIAVIFYQLIFNTHPFSVLGGTRFTDGTERGFYVKNKCFAWGRNRKFLHQQTLTDVWHSNFPRISGELQQLFVRAFDSDTPQNRPGMMEWRDRFQDFISDQGSSGFKKLFKSK
jgi:serine/threonine protein kinase